MKRSIKIHFIIILFFISFFVSIIVIASPVSAASKYKIGFKEDQEVEYKVTKVDKHELKDIYGEEWKDYIGDENAYQEGAKMKMRVDEIDENYKSYIFRVIVDLWDWLDPDYQYNDEPTDEELDLSVYKKPSRYNDTTISDLGYFYVPTPVDSYLDHVDWAHNWKIKGNSIKYEGKVEEHYTIVWTYDPNSGLLSKYELLNKHDSTVYMYEQQLISIPGYELPILLIITALSTIGIILYVIKKKVINY